MGMARGRQRERKRLRGERPTARSRASHQDPGWRTQGGMCQESREGVRPRARVSQPLRTPGSWSGGVRVICVPRGVRKGQGEWRLGGRRVQGRPLVGEGICRSREQGNVRASPGDNESSLPGPRPGPAQPQPLQTLTDPGGT